MKNDGLGNFNSFLLALAVYIFVVGFVFFKLVDQELPAVKYTDLKDSFVDIELADSSEISIPKQKTIDEKPANKEEELDVEKLFAQTTNKAVKTESVNQKATDFNALFGNVKEIQEEKTTKVQSSAQSSSKTTIANQSASQLVSQLNDNLIPDEIQKDGSNIQSQRTGIYDEFLGKVTRVITQRWKQYYPSGQIAVIVKIVIDSDGKFSYTSVEKSGNPLFDEKVLEFLESQKDKFIAYPPKGEPVRISMNLKDEVKTQ